MTIVSNNSISGITTFTDSTDVVNKKYVDDTISSISLPSQTGNDGKFLTTTDGATLSWGDLVNQQEFTSPGISTYTVSDEASIVHIQMISGGSGGNSGITTAKENEFSRWTLRTIGYVPADDFEYTSDLYENNLYVVTGNYSTLSTSTDSIVWTLRTTPLPSINWWNDVRDIAYGNDGFVAAGSTFTVLSTSHITLKYFRNKEIIHSTDTIVWTLRTIGTVSSFTNTPEVENLIYGGGIYFATLFQSNNLYSELLASTDTIVWRRRTVGVNLSNNSTIKNISYDNTSGIYIMAGQDGLNTDARFSTSTDSIVWTLRTVGDFSTYNTTAGGVLSANGEFIATVQRSPSSTPPFLLHSTDSISWVLRTTGLIDKGSITKLSFVNGKYVGSYVNGSGLVSQDLIEYFYQQFISSTDSIVWTSSKRYGYGVEFSGIDSETKYGRNNSFARFTTINPDGIYYDSNNEQYYTSFTGGNPREYYTTVSSSKYVSGGAPGFGGVYSEIYIPKSHIDSDLTLNVGFGGTGGTNEGEHGYPGTASTVSWSFKGLDFFVDTNNVDNIISIGSTIPTFSYAEGNGINGIGQTGLYQITGGGSGAGSTGIQFFGGSSGQSNLPGFTTATPGGFDAQAITGVFYGFGGGGGNSDGLIVGDGKNGVRGGGGGGGAGGISTFGAGGNGGDGCIKIAWW